MFFDKAVPLVGNYLPNSLEKPLLLLLIHSVLRVDLTISPAGSVTSGLLTLI
jgi:hypothetical protein